MEYFDFLITLKESIKLLPKNGKLVAFVALFSIICSSSSFLLFSYSLQSLMVNMFVTFQQSFMPDPNSFNGPDPDSLTPKTGLSPLALIRHLREDFAILLAVQISFPLVVSVISFFTSISTILISATSYSATNNLSLKELFSMIGKIWTRPLITRVYILGLATGYWITAVMMVGPLLMWPNLAAFWISVFLGVLACVLYLYLFVDWALAVVVSVVDESCYGIEAIGKAGKLVKGKRLNGFFINLSVNLVVLIIFQGLKMVLGGNKGFVSPTLYGLFMVIVSCLVEIFLVVAYTVLYFQCKVYHGEEVELQGSTLYSKLSTTQLDHYMP